MLTQTVSGSERAHSRTNLLLLALTYFLYFGQLGVLVPYLGIFLDGRGFSSADIGNLIAMITLSRVLVPSIWAGIADKTGNALGVLRIGCLLSALFFVLVFYLYSFWGLALAFGLMMMFWNAVLPQLEVVTMQSLGPTNTSYGQVRLWGSVGYIVLSVAVGKALDISSSEAPVYACMGLLVGLFLASLFIRQPAPNPSHAEVQGTLWNHALKSPFVIFLISATLLQVSFGAYYGFFALYMRDLNYTGQETGMLIALGVVAEVGIFLLARRLIARFGVWNLLFGCMLLTAFRWYALAQWAENGWVVMLVQLIHALSFGLIHATSVHFIHTFLPAKFHSRGQALYISMAFGVGGAFGNFAAGQLWQQGSQAWLTFAAAALVCGVGGLVLLFTSRRDMDNTTS